jgi:hypothetical protein
LLEEKTRELTRMDLKEQSAKREKKIAVEESKMKRKQAVVDRVGASLSAAVNTASGIMKAVETFWVTGGMPWAGIIGGLGAVQQAAIWSAPLPEVISAANGGSMVTDGLTPLIVGDNPSGRERVTVEPMGFDGSPVRPELAGNNLMVNGDIVITDARSPEKFARDLKKYVQTHGEIA